MGLADRDQGSDEEGRSQGRDRRDPEQEAHSRTQATAMMMAQSGADGGRSHAGDMAADSRGPTNGGGAGGGGAEVETESQRARGMHRIWGARVGD